MDNELMHNVFVYGTLRSTEYNHKVMQQLNHKFLGTAKIPGEVVQLTFPAFRDGNGEVEGEVYAVDADGLQTLDYFEGHPRLYERKEIKTTEGLSVNVYYGNSIFEGRRAFYPQA